MVRLWVWAKMLVTRLTVLFCLPVNRQMDNCHNAYKQIPMRYIRVAKGFCKLKKGTPVASIFASLWALQKNNSWRCSLTEDSYTLYTKIHTYDT